MCSQRKQSIRRSENKRERSAGAVIKGKTARRRHLVAAGSEQLGPCAHSSPRTRFMRSQLYSSRCCTFSRASLSPACTLLLASSNWGQRSREGSKDPSIQNRSSHDLRGRKRQAVGRSRSSMQRPEGMQPGRSRKHWAKHAAVSAGSARQGGGPRGATQATPAGPATGSL